MDASQIGDYFSQAMFLVLLSVVVIITPSLIVGLIVSVFQAATQINEQTLSFLPRLVVAFLALLIVGPWIMNALIDFTLEIYTNIPFIIG
ncbi:MAG: flagellar biosynthesis protein FliQ [Venatoribacter sp.]